MKTREIADTPEKGQLRNQTYRSLIGKYKSAVDKGFYLEAITLMESLLADRLTSQLVYEKVLGENENYRTLNQCINKAKDSGSFPSDLLGELKDWWDKRNEAIHEMAKIEVGGTDKFEDRYSKWKIVAGEGYELFKKVKSEERK